MTDYTALYFNTFNSKNIDYELRVVDGSELMNYMDWKRPNLVGFDSSHFLTRQPADEYHEGILRQFAGQLNPRVGDYRIEFDKVRIDQDVDDLRPPSEANSYNPLLFGCFMIALGSAYFINCIFVLTAVCDEKRTKSFDFLKLMGASDGQILFGHFVNHLLFWGVAFIICLGYFVQYFGSVRVPTQATLVMAVFGLLFLVHLIIFMFLLSTLFTRALYPELLNILSFFFVYRSESDVTSQTGFIAFLKLAHPVSMEFGFFKTVEPLCHRFDFRGSHSLLEIFNYSDGKQYSLTQLVLIGLLFIVIEIALTNYIIQVNPFQSGVHKPFHYFLTWQYWRRAEPVTEYTPLGDQKEFEKVPTSSRPAIILKGVDKWFKSWFVFGKFQVLKHFDFAIYEKQITVLLGHNGAGKSTTMNLIAGLSTADQGSITVNGIPVSGYTSEFKSQLGYCPQENVFYEQLSVAENLRIAATLKGLSLCASSRKIHALTSKFELQAKLDECAKNLSGGMKRRLCLAMAVIGYNDVLVIDEPTSGLDPETRRRIWEILLELRKYKTILLTTHFLEEADILGDSIAIMYDGKVRCCGSTMFLKKLYHVGYLLRVQTAAAAAAADPHIGDALLQLIREHLPDAFLETQRANERFYRLTCKAQENLNLMIAGLLESFENEQVKSKYAIEGFGLTNTTLEDVFIKIGTLCDQSEQAAIAMDSAVEQHPLHRMQRLRGPMLYAQQFWAIQCKKLKMSYKNLALLFQSIYLPTFPVLIAFMFMISMGHLLETKDINIDTFNLRQAAAGTEVLILRNAGDAEEGLFRSENRKWLEREYGLHIVESKEMTAQKAIAELMPKYSRSGLRNRLLIVPEQSGKFNYSISINPYKLPYSLVGTLEAVYRLIAREANREDSDFGVNFKFSYSQTASQSNQNVEIQAGKKFSQVFQVSLSRLGLAFATAFLLSIMFAFSLVGFVELPHEEMNSGVSIFLILICPLQASLFLIHPSNSL